MEKGTISVDTQNIFPIIKKWLYSDKDIFLREVEAAKRFMTAPKKEFRKECVIFAPRGTATVL